MVTIQKITHECGWEKEVLINCPACGGPMCLEDTEQCSRNTLIHSIHNEEVLEKHKDRLKKLEDDYADLKDKFQKLKEDFKVIQTIVQNCGRCNQ